MEDFAHLKKAVIENNSKLSKNKFGRNNDIPNFEDIIARRDYLIYRLGSSSHQLCLLEQTITAVNKRHKTINMAKD